MRQFKIPTIPSSEITPEGVYRDRRRFMTAAALGPLALSMASSTVGSELSFLPASKVTTSGASADEALTPYEHVTSYNNFYEFGYQKDDPARYADRLSVDPWSISVGGLVNNPKTLALEDLLASVDLEERIYRLRCVEAWSMVIPWVGFPLASLLKQFDLQGSGKYVRFETLHRPSEMPGQKSLFSGIDYPYVEGLRLDEAMHPLTILAVGLYGKTMPNQNGAPIRLVVPWKYGFKSIKSIVKIDVVEDMPQTTWALSAPHEYGFYANVNPGVSHPRWSQSRERRLPSGLFSKNVIDTQMFNGYQEQVASLYSDLDLRIHY